MADREGPEHDWTRHYRLAAGVYAVRDDQLLMLKRAGGMMRGFWSIPAGMVDPGESPQEAAARELLEEAGLTPTGPLWLVTAVHLKGYGMDLLSLRYACPCADGDVQLSHEHSEWRWYEPKAYRDAHLSPSEAERWGQSNPDDEFNVLSNRNGLDEFLRWWAGPGASGP